MCSIIKNRNKTPNDFLFSKNILPSPQSNETNEQQDNESLNTMDYYKEDISNKNTLPFQTKAISKKLNRKKESMNSIISVSFTNPNNDKKEFNTKKKHNFIQSSSFYIQKNKGNLQNCFEDSKTSRDYCSRCNSKADCYTKACPYCLKPFCRNCLKEIFNRNLDNNDDIENFDQDIINEKMCPNCRNLANIKDYIIIKKNKILGVKFIEPLDSFSNNKTQTQSPKRINGHKSFSFVKGLEEEYKKHDILLNKIEEMKKDLEIRKNINLNILQIMQKVMEYEYNQNINKLNEMISKLKSIKNSIKEKFNQNQDNNNNNNLEIKKNINNYNNIMKHFSNNYDKLNKKIILKSKQKSYILHESKKLLVNLSDTYYMKYTEILSNNNIGKVYIKINRLNNNYTNYLNFSVLIMQDEKQTQNKKNNTNNKSKFIVNIIINNKLMKMNKVNKENNNNKLCTNYECFLNENKFLLSNNNSNSIDNNFKKDNLNIKVIISELIL